MSSMLGNMKRSWSGSKEDLDCIMVASIPGTSSTKLGKPALAKVNESRLNAAQSGTSDAPLDLRTPSPEKKHRNGSTSCSASELGAYIM